MARVTEEIVKQLASGSGSGGGSASLALVNTLNSTVTKLESSLRTLTGEVKTSALTLVTHSSNITHLQSKIQQDANDLTTQFNHLLPKVNIIGPPPPTSPTPCGRRSTSYATSSASRGWTSRGTPAYFND